jgi:hypothetical protein
MSKIKKDKRGGAREGAGRKTMFSSRMVSMTITIPEEMREEVREAVRKMKAKHLKKSKKVLR